MKKLSKKCLNNLNKFEIFLLIFMFWASLWPIVFPNWRSDGYKQIDDKDIESDLILCGETDPNNNSNPIGRGISDCPLIAPDLGQI